jgi:hypothetical protein
LHLKGRFEKDQTLSATVFIDELLIAQGEVDQRPTASWLKTTCGSVPANSTKPASQRCCQSVAALLPVLLPLKCLPGNRVTDVATLGNSKSAHAQRQTGMQAGDRLGAK